MQELRKALGHGRLHLFIQSYTLVFIPLAVTLLVKSLSLTHVLDKVFLDGSVAEEFKPNKRLFGYACVHIWS